MRTFLRSQLENSEDYLKIQNHIGKQKVSRDSWNSFKVLYINFTPLIFWKASDYTCLEKNKVIQPEFIQECTYVGICLLIKKQHSHAFPFQNYKILVKLKNKFSSPKFFSYKLIFKATTIQQPLQSYKDIWDMCNNI